MPVVDHSSLDDRAGLLRLKRLGYRQPVQRMKKSYNLIANMKNSRHLTIVIKIGTSSIVDETTHEPILPILSLIVDTAIKLKRDGHRVVLVSSGAIGVGLQRMDISKKPKHLPQKQALAAIGQCRLMTIWDSLFTHYRQPVAQILFTRNDIADRSQYINAQNTLNEVLNYGVIPIVNENDTLAVSEIKFGDNDTLSAITAAMVHADYLFLMTDVEALYTKNPRQYPDAMPIREVEDIDALTVDVSSKGSDLGTGGMATKITAARLATSAGVTTIITKSSKPGNIKDIITYLHPTEASSPNGTITPASSQEFSSEPPLHTRFLPSTTPIRNRAFWILHGLAPHGTIYIDRGASRALQNRAGLLPVGIVDVEGHFNQQEAVRIVVVDRKVLGSLQPAPPEETNESSSPKANGHSSKPSLAKLPSSGHILTLKGEEIGRAVVNYSSAEIQRIKGLRSSEIASKLGYADSEYVAFRENVSLHAASRPGTPTARPATPTNPAVGALQNSQHLIGSVTPIGLSRQSTSRSSSDSLSSSRNHSPDRGSLDLKDLRFDDVKTKRGSIGSVVSHIQLE